MPNYEIGRKSLPRMLDDLILTAKNIGTLTCLAGEQYRAEQETQERVLQAIRKAIEARFADEPVIVGML